MVGNNHDLSEDELMIATLEDQSRKMQFVYDKFTVENVRRRARSKIGSTQRMLRNEKMGNEGSNIKFGKNRPRE